MSPPRVSLLLPNRNNGAILDHVLERLQTNTTYPDFELIAIDDGSTDDSRAILRRWQERLPALQLIEREHAGVIDALNAGLAAATGELVVQLDADASVETKGWLERMVGFLTADERIGVVTAKVVFDWGEIHTCGVNVLGPDGFYSRGATITEPIGRRTYHERVRRLTEADAGVECAAPAEVDGGAGTCMLYRRDVALEVGGYDPEYAPVWFDDVDLTLSIRRYGQKVFFLPDVRVIHHVGRRAAGAPARRRADAAARTVVRRALPARFRHRLAAGLNINPLPAEQWARIQHHYGYWRQKWDFDLLNPDVGEIQRRWSGTELCWRTDPEMRAAGEQIVAAFTRSEPAATASS